MYTVGVSIYKSKKVKGEFVQDEKRKKLSINMNITDDLMEDFKKGDEEVDTLIGCILVEAMREEYFKRYKKV